MSSSHPGPREPLTDATLVQRARRGETIAYAELVKRHYGRGHRLAYGLLGCAEAADQAAQEAFAHFGLLLPQLPEPVRLVPWLARLLVHYCSQAEYSNGDRGQRPGRCTAVGASPSRWPPPVLQLPQASHSGSWSADLSRLLAPLAAGDRLVLLLRELENLSYADIATILRLPQLLVQERLARARRLIRHSVAQTVAAPGHRRPRNIL